MLKIGITQGGSGYYAVLYNTETMEPIETGIGRYDIQQEAAHEALEWAINESVAFEDDIAELLGPGHVESVRKLMGVV